MNWFTHGLFYYFLPVASLCFLFLYIRDYGYSNLLIYIAYLLRRLSLSLINEARNAKDVQGRNAEKVGRRIMELDDEWFQMIKEGKERK